MEGARGRSRTEGKKAGGGSGRGGGRWRCDGRAESLITLVFGLSHSVGYDFLEGFAGSA